MTFNIACQKCKRPYDCDNTSKCPNCNGTGYVNNYGILPSRSKCPACSSKSRGTKK